MTRAGKCDTCRIRKVKCDQSRPSCGACGKGGRPCSYKFADTYDASRHTRRTTDPISRTATATASHTRPEPKCAKGKLTDTQFADGSGLVLRTARPADRGQGVFFTLARDKRAAAFSPPCTPSPSAGLFDDTSLLLARWMSMMSCLQPQCTSSILHKPTEAEETFDEGFFRLGMHQLKDEAVAYVLDTYHAFLTPTVETQSIARKAGLKVTQSLRLAIANGADYRDNELLYVIGMLELSESMHGWQTWRQQYHSLAMARLLKIRWKTGSWTELDEIFARCCYLEEVQEAVVAGTLSEFDDPLRLERRKQINFFSSYDLGVMCIMDNLVCAPRLICHLREVLFNPDDNQNFLDALTLAQQMYHDERRWQIEQALQKATKSRAEASRQDHSQRIPEFKFIYMTEHYHMWRIIVCGVILKLYDVDPFAVSTVFDIASIEAEDLAHATAMLDIADEALLNVAGPPLTALTLIMPMIVSYGCWKRLEQRTLVRDDFPSQQVTLTLVHDMKTLCVDHVSSVMDRWKATGWQLDDMVDRLSDAFAGGPTLNWLSRRGKSLDEVEDESTRIDRPTI